MATTTETLDADGLAEVAWDACDGPLAGRLAASPQDARGRGMLLRVTRGSEPLDLSGDGIRLYLLWRHRQTHARGCEPMEAEDAAAGAFHVFWPAAMCAAEGVAECEVVLSWGERALATPAFDVEVGTSLAGTLAVPGPLGGELLMGMGMIGESVLGDIANAIREQNGTATTYKPTDMAAAIAALDGTKSGKGTTRSLGGGSGVVSDSVFSSIAGAIRGQNGLDTK